MNKRLYIKSKIIPAKDNKKYPSYMLYFFIKYFNNKKIDIYSNEKQNEKNTEKIKLIYPVYRINLNDNRNIYLCPDSILELFKSSIRSKYTPKYIKILSLIRYIQYFIIMNTWRFSSGNFLVVGKKDLNSLISYGIKKAYYFPHPCPNEYFKCDRVTENDLNNKLTIGFSGALGRFSMFYCGTLIEKIIERLSNENLSKEIKFVITGSDWKKVVSKLRKLGYEVEYDNWTENYINFLNKIDIYLAPVIAGAGTKNRVLSALAAGIPVIGTDIAYENIVVDGKSFIHNNPSEFVDQIKNFIDLKNNQGFLKRNISRLSKVHTEENVFELLDKIFNENIFKK
jgi:glycosyltransferase involved in cell wall biosynthesis